MAECPYQECPLGFNLETRDELQKLKDDVEAATKGVSNFREFQKQGIAFFNFSRGVMKACAVVGALVIVFLAWALNALIPAAKIIIDDYYHNHPAVSEQIQKSTRGALEMSTSATMNAGSQRIYDAYTGR